MTSRATRHSQVGGREPSSMPTSCTSTSFAVIEKFASYGVESSTEDRNSRHSSQRFVRSLGKVWLTMQWSNCRALY